MDTSTSLLERLRDRHDEAAWRRLDSLYRPLILKYVLRDPGLAAEAEDLTQEILAVVCREIAGFHRRRTGSFRRWLRKITAHRVQSHYRKRRTQDRVMGAQEHREGLLSGLADDRSELARSWDEEHNRHVVRRLFELLDRDTRFGERNVEAFRLLILSELTPAEAAGRLGLTLDAVLTAKSRILKRLRKEAEGLLD
jgi:RNA polymerase sigma-70 factor (ECF subfamily)